MLAPDIDKSYERFKGLAGSADSQLSESDSRAKIIDSIFKECLGWDEEDITREEHVVDGYVDYVFRVQNRPRLILEAKKFGSSFTIPAVSRKRQFKISGSITTDRKVKSAIDQVQRYSTEMGTTLAAVSNGHQFILFESFKHCGKWRDGLCTTFRSLEDIADNFTLFWNILSKEAMTTGSWRTYVSGEAPPLDFTRPLDLLHNEEASAGKNSLAVYLTPIINYIFTDLTDDSKIEILRRCYVRQRQLAQTDRIIKSDFDRLPHYAKQFDINWFRESAVDAGGFQVSFEKCSEFLRTKTPTGSTIILLGGVGSGKTTFIHHFFKGVMNNRDDVLWFYVDFSKSPPDLDRIENFIFDSIVHHYENHYKTRLGGYLKSVGLSSIDPERRGILVFFAMLRYKGYAVSIVLDNADQHSYTTPKYQERIFEVAQNLTNDFKCITILTLREESFFKSTRSGVLDAYNIPKFHIESPDFEQLIRSRVEYTLEFLQESRPEIIDESNISSEKRREVRLFFTIISNSIRRTRRVGQDILRFINDVSGGNMRQALRFFNTFMTSGNTDVEEMISIESMVPIRSPPSRHYQIPLHHIVKSIVLEDYKYYTSAHSNIMNLLQVNPQHSPSHLTHLRILAYLRKRMNYFVALDKGFVDINQVIQDADSAGISQKAIEDSMRKLSLYGLIEYDNQNKEGYDSAVYAKITTAGKYYLECLVNSFAYLDMMLADTPICDQKISQELRKKLTIDDISDKRERTHARFERTEIFLNYLKQMEEEEFKGNPALVSSDLTRARFVDRVTKEYFKEKNYIQSRL